MKRPFRVRVSWREDQTEEIMLDAPSVTPSIAPSSERSRQASRPRSRPPRPVRSAPDPGPGESDLSDLTPAALGELGGAAAELTREILALMGIDAGVKTAVDGEGVRIDLDSDQGEALLIGKRGETRAALQHVINRILSRRAGTFTPVLVDVAQYWERRLDRLMREARELADRAARKGVAAQSEPLSPQERRVIHRALTDDARVTTESIGKGLHKCVLVRPRAGAEED
jgi:spoIIIJ-associated protein